MKSLTIIDTTIRQDDQKRFCLNDLHKASGGIAHHRPSKWLATKQAKLLVAELESEARIRASPITSIGLSQSPNSGFGIAPINAIHGGEWNGTFVVKELVYAYAMWISPAFHLKVIRAYDAMVSGELFDTSNRLAKATRVYFERYPKDREIRAHAEQGFPYWWIAQKVGRCAGTVGKAVARMVRWGFMNAEFRRTQAAPMKFSRWLRQQQQVPLF